MLIGIQFLAILEFVAEEFSVILADFGVLLFEDGLTSNFHQLPRSLIGDDVLQLYVIALDGGPGDLWYVDADADLNQECILAMGNRAAAG